MVCFTKNILLTIGDPPIISFDPEMQEEGRPLRRQNGSNKRRMTNEQRMLVINAVDVLGKTISETANLFCVNRNTVGSIMKLFYEQGRAEKSAIRWKSSTDIERQ